MFLNRVKCGAATGNLLWFQHCGALKHTCKLRWPETGKQLWLVSAALRKPSLLHKLLGALLGCQGLGPPSYQRPRCKQACCADHHQC